MQGCKWIPIITPSLQRLGISQGWTPTFYKSKVDEDPQGLIDEVFKVLDAMDVSSQEKAELAAYQLKDVA